MSPAKRSGPGRGRGGRPPAGGRQSAGGRQPDGGRGGPRPRPERARGAGPQPDDGPRRQKPRGLDGTQVEGRQAVRELLLAGTRRCKEILLSNEVERRDIIEDIVQLAAELRVPLREVSRSRLDAAARTEAPQGVIARAAPLPEASLEDLMRTPKDAPPPFLLALDGVTDPGNLGALLRTAECAGVSGVVLPQHRAVHVTPTVTKAAAGAVEHLPMALVGGLPTAITRMRDAGLWVVGLDADGDTSVFDLPAADGPVCLVLGAEGAGLSQLVRRRCDAVASIPLGGRVGSLNVSTAGAVACFEVVRRRTARPVE